MPRTIPFWKLRRELARVGTKLANLPAMIASIPVRRSEPRRREEHERNFDRLTRLFEGALTERKRIAIFLIYQPSGVAASIVETCRWLAAEGFAPFVVSNGALKDTDRSILQAQSWRLLERPNFGYDFGGYRDAIRLIWRWNLAPERLIVMNDSVWIPMVPALMARLEAAAGLADIVGALKDVKVQHDRSGGQETDAYYLESYFYYITANGLNHKAFRSFWEDYRMTDDKPKTIKHGEIGFSRAMAAAGLRLHALSERSVFMKRIALQEDEFLLRTLRHAAYGDSDLSKAATRLSQSNLNTPDWRAAALDHICRTVNRRRFNASFPYANDRIFGTLIMKKSKEPIFVGMRDAYLRAIEAGDVPPPPPTILAEIKARSGPCRPGYAVPPWASPNSLHSDGA